MSSLLERRFGRLRVGRRTMRGVTLMELLVVVAVIGILAAIGIPSYRRYLIRSQRSAAKIALLQLQTAQEKFYLQNNIYTDDITTASPTGLGLLGVSEASKYEITVALQPDANGTAAQGFVATATPTTDGGQADDTECGNFTIDERGTRGVSGGAGPQLCWK